MKSPILSLLSVWFLGAAVAQSEKRTLINQTVQINQTAQRTNGAATSSAWVTRCNLAGWDQNGPLWEITISSGSTVRKKTIERVVRWGATPQRYSSACVRLVGGTELECHIEGFDLKQLNLRSDTLLLEPIPWDFVTAIFPSPSISGGEKRNALRRVANSASGPDDLVQLVDATQLRGTLMPEEEVLLKPSATRVQLLVNGSQEAAKRVIALAEIAVLAPSPALRGAPTLSQRSLIGLNDGSALSIHQIDPEGRFQLSCGLTGRIVAEENAWWSSIVAVTETMGKWLEQSSLAGFVSQPVVGETAFLNQTLLVNQPYGLLQFVYPKVTAMPSYAQAAFTVPAGTRKLLGEVTLVAPDSEQSSGTILGLQILAGKTISTLSKVWAGADVKELGGIIPFEVELSDNRLVVLATEPLAAGSIATRAIWLDLRWSD